MKRTNQYKIFYPFYESEEKRYADLTQRATIMLSLVSGLALFAGVGTPDKVKLMILSNALNLVLLGISSVALLLSALSSVVSIAVRDYKDVCNVEQIVLQIEKEKYSEEDVYSVLLANLADAIVHNRLVNNRRATWLLSSTIFLSVSVVFFILLNVLALAYWKGS